MGYTPIDERPYEVIPKLHYPTEKPKDPYDPFNTGWYKEKKRAY